MNGSSARILIDLDNVLSKSDPIFRELIRRRTGRDLSQKDVTSFDYARVAALQPFEYEDILNEFHVRCATFAKRVFWARQSLKWLNYRFWVTVITGRPSEFETETRTWLHRNNFAFDELLFSNNKKEVAFGSAFLVEDNGETALAASKYCVVYLMDYPWNRFAHGVNVTRVSGWRELLRDVKARLNTVPIGADLRSAFPVSGEPTQERELVLV